MVAEPRLQIGEGAGALRECTRTYEGYADQLQDVRAFLAEILDGCPMTDDAVLIADELATNAVRHSDSGQPGGHFTVRVEIRKPDYVRIEVEDDGGRRSWAPRVFEEEPWHGFSIIRHIAGDGNWGIEGHEKTRVVWARLNWPAPRPSCGQAGGDKVAGACLPI